MSSTILPQRLLQGLGAKARRSLGQHFLKAPWVLDHIMEAAAITDGDLLLEIGPGLGVLTERLAASGAPLVALEKDERLAAHLRESLGRWPNLTVIETDALRFDLGTLPASPRYKVVANLPYNVATPLLFRLVEEGPGFSDLVVMIQKEVADRILADPGTRAYGALTVKLRFLAEGHRVVDVPPSAFHPRPKVDSTVIHLRPFTAPPDDPGEERMFSRVVAAAFNARRKTLRNALNQGGLGAGMDIDAALAAAGIDGGIRGERLDLATFCALSRAFVAQKAGVAEGEGPSDG